MRRTAESSSVKACTGAEGLHWAGACRGKVFLSEEWRGVTRGAPWRRGNPIKRYPHCVLTARDSSTERAGERARITSSSPSLSAFSRLVSRGVGERDRVRGLMPVSFGRRTVICMRSFSLWRPTFPNASRKVAKGIFGVYVQELREWMPKRVEVCDAVPQRSFSTDV